MKRSLFRLMALLMPTRKLRNKIRRLGGAKIIDYGNPIQNIISHALDISNVPPARGYLRQVQIANMKLLQAFDQLCVENKLDYFLLGGAIIGLLRHGGCVPWDDDIDIGMRADDYARLLDLVTNTMPNNEFYINVAHNVMHIVHTDSKAFLDILRYEVCETGDCYDPDIADDLAWRLYKFTREIHDGYYLSEWMNTDLSEEKIQKTYAKLKTDYGRVRKLHARFFGNLTGAHHSVIPMDALCKPGEIYDYNTIFPTQRMRFDGFEFLFPNDPELYAIKCWGDIWKFPNDITRRHAYAKDITPQRLIALRRFNALTQKQIYDILTQIRQ